MVRVPLIQFWIQRTYIIRIDYSMWHLQIWFLVSITLRSVSGYMRWGKRVCHYYVMESCKFRCWIWMKSCCSIWERKCQLTCDFRMFVRSQSRSKYKCCSWCVWYFESANFLAVISIPLISYTLLFDCRFSLEIESWSVFTISVCAIFGLASNSILILRNVLAIITTRWIYCNCAFALLIVPRVNGVNFLIVSPIESRFLAFFTLCC